MDDSLGTKAKSCMNKIFLFPIIFPTILRKAIFVVERNFAENFSIGLFQL